MLSLKDCFPFNYILSKSSFTHFNCAHISRILKWAVWQIQETSIWERGPRKKDGSFCPNHHARQREVSTNRNVQTDYPEQFSTFFLCILFLGELVDFLESGESDLCLDDLTVTLDMICLTLPPSAECSSIDVETVSVMNGEQVVDSSCTIGESFINSMDDK